MQGIVTLHGVEHERYFQFCIHSFSTSKTPSIKWYHNLLGGNLEFVEPEYIPMTSGKKMVAARYINRDGAKRWKLGEAAFFPWICPVEVRDSPLNMCFGKLLYLNKDGVNFKAFECTEPIVKYLMNAIEKWSEINKVKYQIYYNNKLV